MKTVRINKRTLLEKLVENRAAHALDYEEAMVGYRKAAVDKLQIMLKDTIDGKEIKSTLGLVEPVSRLSDYDKELSMLNMSADTTIELTATEFDCYVLDNWGWKSMALSANATYKGMS
jgi:hypothetical protein